MTDELASYEKVGKEFANHGTVCHASDEYVRLGGFVHVNTAECRFSLMKRAVFGTHHSISEAHLPRYLAEWDFKMEHPQDDRRGTCGGGPQGHRGQASHVSSASLSRRRESKKPSDFCAGGGAKLLDSRSRIRFQSPRPPSTFLGRITAACGTGQAAPERR